MTVQEWIRDHRQMVLFFGMILAFVVGLIGAITETMLAAGWVVSGVLGVMFWWSFMAKASERIADRAEQKRNPPRSAPLVTPHRSGSFGPAASHIPPSRRCPACGKLAEKTDRFCGSCGNRIY